MASVPGQRILNTSQAVKILNGRLLVSCLAACCITQSWHISAHVNWSSRHVRFSANTECVICSARTHAFMFGSMLLHASRASKRSTSDLLSRHVRSADNIKCVTCSARTSLVAVRQTSYTRHATDGLSRHMRSAYNIKCVIRSAQHKPSCKTTKSFVVYTTLPTLSQCPQWPPTFRK